MPEATNEGKTIDFIDLKLSTPSRTIFSGATGKIKSSKMVALMGPSGAGKTSLLNSIAGRIPNNLILKGEILVNGHKRNQNEWPQLVGYVEQDFYAYENQTVEETFQFLEKLKLKNSECENSEVEIKSSVCGTSFEKVEDLIKILNLENVAKSRLKDLSGGERKRVSIGVELVNNPKILFLDEPLSGLDSFNAIKILNVLSNLTKLGKTILCTIHQPSVKMLEFFDSVIYMGGGKIVYEGTFEECCKFFGENGFVCPKFTNPSDFFLEIISINRDGEFDEGEKNLKILQDAWEKKFKFESTVVERDFSVLDKNESIFKECFDLAQDLNSFVLLFYRNLLNNARDIGYLKVQIFQKIIFALLIGLTFLQLGFDQKDIQSRVGLINFLLLNTLFGVAGPIFNVFAIEKKIITRERKSGFYSGYSAYYAKYFSELIYILVFNLIYISAVYWMVGVNNNVGNFFEFLIVISIAITFSISFGFTISTLTESQQSAQVLGTTIIIVFVLYGGLFANPDTIKPWLAWITYLSPVNYTFRASMLLLIKNLSFNNGTDGSEVVEQYGADGINVVSCCAVIVGYTLLWSLIGATVLHFGTKINVKMEK